MLSISPAAGSTEYYGADNYYFDDGRASTQWFGKGAAALGLSGEVERDDYDAMYKGHLPNGIKLSRMKDGEWKHYPGWDLTFAAPKSVSVMAEIVGDRRLIDAHDKAVQEALAWVEAEHAVTRIRQDNEIQRVHTGNIATAIYRHDISRAKDPHLHSHAIVMNATIDADGKWRSLDGRYLWQDLAAKDAGLRYQQALARHVAELGYEVIPRANGTFEINGVPLNVIDGFSKRTRDMEAYLAARGLDRDSATTEQRNLAMQRTRQDKGPAVEPEKQRARWREEVAEMGHRLDELGRSSEQAQDRAARPGHLDDLQREASASARKAVGDAAKSLVERDAIFSDRALREQASVFSLGKASAQDIDAAVKEAARAGELIFREAKQYVSPTQEFEPTTGWTTPAAKRTEIQMMAIEKSGRDAMAPAFEAEAARGRIEAAMKASEKAGYGWNDAQKRAAEGLLLSPNRVTAIQGYAGTAKTTTVLASYVGAMRGRGHDVTVMAPTNVAADVLGEAVGQEGKTVQRHLIEQQRSKSPPSSGRGRQVWVVDEASLLSAHHMRDLLRSAERAEARVVMVGDVMQLGSVESGRAFSQLQDAGMRTYILDKIVRQQNPDLRQAVEAGLRADAQGMLHHLQHGGGTVTTMGREKAGDSLEEQWRTRINGVADHYMSLTPGDRAKALVIDPSREGRDELNVEIRRRKRDQHELSGPALVADILVSKDLTNVQKRLALSYQEGDVVRFAKDYGPKANPAIQKDAYLVVTGTSPATSEVTLKNNNGQAIIWKPEQWTKVEAYTQTRREMRAGDTITFTRTDPAINAKNGQTAEVKAVDPEAKMALLQKPGEQPMTINLRDQRHWDHGYARTAYLAQGGTADRALIHLESWRANVVQMRSAYVAVSRGKLEAHVYTDDANKLQRGLETRNGAKSAAMDLSAFQASRATVTAAQRVPTPAMTQASKPPPQPMITSAVPAMGR